MDSPNVELARSIFDRWSRGDFEADDWADERIAYTHIHGSMRLEWHGMAGLREGWTEWLNAWDQFQGVLEEVRAVDGERVLGLWHWGGQGRTSGVDLAELSPRGGTLMRIRDGRVIELTFYADVDDALRDVG